MFNISPKKNLNQKVPVSLEQQLTWMGRELPSSLCLPSHGWLPADPSPGESRDASERARSPGSCCAWMGTRAGADLQISLRRCRQRVPTGRVVGRNVHFPPSVPAYGKWASPGREMLPQLEHHTLQGWRAGRAHAGDFVGPGDRGLRGWVVPRGSGTAPGAVPWLSSAR